MKIGVFSFHRWGFGWHWGWSLTWRWVFDIRRHNPNVMLGFHRIRTHVGTCWHIVWNTRYLDFVFQSQPNMFHYKIRERKIDKWIEGLLK